MTFDKLTPVLSELPFQTSKIITGEHFRIICVQNIEFSI